MYKQRGDEKHYQLYIKEAVFECMTQKGEDHPKTLKLKKLADSFDD